MAAPRWWVGSRRRLALGSVVLIGVLVAAGCEGPASTTTASFRAHCIVGNIADPDVVVEDLGEFDFDLSARSPEWITRGDTAWLRSVTLRGGPPGRVGPGWMWVVHVVPRGLGPLRLRADGVPDNVIVGVDGGPSEVGGEVTGASGSYATVGFTGLSLHNPTADPDFVNPTNCTPLPGQASRLAAIEIR